MKRTTLIASAFLFALAASVLNAATTEVSMLSTLRFNPQSVTINVGDTVRWTNQSGLTHTTTSGTDCTPDGLFWNSGSLTPGQSFSVVFNEPGTFPYFCDVPFHCEDGMTGTVTVEGTTQVMPVPSGQFVFDPYPGIVSPVASVEPAQARPVAVGAVAEGGGTLSIAVQTAQLAGPVDVYFAIYAPEIVQEVFVLRSDGTFQGLTTMGLAPWMTGVTGPLNESLFGDIPVALLPSAAYTLFFVITPQGTIEQFYFWSTSFVVP